jgi:hypothetical protein
MKRHTHEQLAATPRRARLTRLAAQRESTARRKELEEV